MDAGISLTIVCSVGRQTRANEPVYEGRTNRVNSANQQNRHESKWPKTLQKKYARHDSQANSAEIPPENWNKPVVKTGNLKRLFRAY